MSPADKTLTMAAIQIVKIAEQDLVKAKEVRNLIKEVLALGDEDEKLRLIGILSTDRPDVIKPMLTVQSLLDAG
jgi:hypothetical protein